MRYRDGLDVRQASEARQLDQVGVVHERRDRQAADVDVLQVKVRARVRVRGKVRGRVRVKIRARVIVRARVRGGGVGG